MMNDSLNNNGYGIQTPINNLNTTQTQIKENQSENVMINKPKKSKSKLLIILLFCIIVVILGIGLFKKFSSNNVVDKEIETLFNDDSLILVKKDSKYGFIDLEGNFVIEPQYESATPFYGNYAEVTFKTKENEVEKEVTGLVDKNGKVQLTANSSYSINYYPEYDLWLVDGSLYDDSLNQLSPDGLSLRYEKYGYFTWHNWSTKTAGIIDKTGKTTYTYNFGDGESYFMLDPSEINEVFKDRYCRIIIDNEKYGIVNCNTGKVIYDYTNYYISTEEGNIFKIMTKDRPYQLISKIYIQNDKILYQTSSDNVDLYYNYLYDYITITDGDKDYSERYSYINISTGEITNEKPSSSISSYDLEDWEGFTKFEKFSCNSGYGLMYGEKIIIPCEWSSISFFDLTLYKYLSSNGKEYIIAKKDNKTYLINLKDKSSVAEFNTTSINTNSYSTFIYYNDIETNNIIIYNLLTGKSISVDTKSRVTTYSNYITIKQDDKLNYYNSDLKLIYTEQ